MLYEQTFRTKHRLHQTHGWCIKRTTVGKDMRFIALILPLALMACTQFPELDGPVFNAGKDAKYPKLLPVDALLAQSNSTGPSPEETASTLSARIAALQDRAAQLRGSVVDTNTQNLIKNGVN